MLTGDKSNFSAIDTIDTPSVASGRMSLPEPERSGRDLSWAQRYAKGQDAQGTRREFWADMDSGWVMVAELVAATFTWGGIGWLADRWLGTAPVLMSVGFVVGFATGFYLVWARATGVVSAPGTTATKSEAHDDG